MKEGIIGELFYDRSYNRNYQLHCILQGSSPQYTSNCKGKPPFTVKMIVFIQFIMADLQLNRIWKKIEMKQYVILQCFTLLNHATTYTGVSFKGLQNSCHSIVKKGYPQQKSFQAMQFNKKANYSKMYNNKWQKSAILACCCQLVCLSHYCWWLITENTSNLPYNDVSHQYLFQLVEAGFHVLVVNSISSKDCGCWTFILLNVFGEMTSILAVF